MGNQCSRNSKVRKAKDDEKNVATSNEEAQQEAARREREAEEAAEAELRRANEQEELRQRQEEIARQEEKLRRAESRRLKDEDAKRAKLAEEEQRAKEEARRRQIELDVREAAIRDAAAELAQKEAAVRAERLAAEEAAARAAAAEEAAAAQAAAAAAAAVAEGPPSPRKSFESTVSMEGETSSPPSSDVSYSSISSASSLTESTETSAPLMQQPKGPVDERWKTAQDLQVRWFFTDSARWAVIGSNIDDFTAVVRNNFGACSKTLFAKPEVMVEDAGYVAYYPDQTCLALGLGTIQHDRSICKVCRRLDLSDTPLFT